MLLIGVVKELRKSTDNYDLLLYFFCQRTDPRLDSSTAVLRGLIWQLLCLRRFLWPPLRELFDAIGDRLSEGVDVDAFGSLSNSSAKCSARCLPQKSTWL